MLEDSVKNTRWPDRREEIALSIQAQAANPSLGQAVSGIVQDLQAMAAQHRWRGLHEDELQALVNEAIMHHDMTAAEIASVTRLDTEAIERLADAAGG